MKMGKHFVNTTIPGCVQNELSELYWRGISSIIGRALIINTI